MMEIFAKIVNGFTICANTSILDVQLVSEYASELGATVNATVRSKRIGSTFKLLFTFIY